MSMLSKRGGRNELKAHALILSLSPENIYRQLKKKIRWQTHLWGVDSFSQLRATRVNTYVAAHTTRHITFTIAVQLG